MINSISGLKGDQVDWCAFAARVQKYRLAKKQTIAEASKELDLTESQLANLENGYAQRERKDVNIVFRVSQKWNLSLNWLLNGQGAPHDEDPIGLLPATLVVQRGAGIRRGEIRVKAEEGCFSDEILEFVMAIDKYKGANGIPFPTLTQLYEIILALGYRKSSPSRIAPLGYIIEHQRWAEKMKQIKEIDQEIERQEEQEAERVRLYKAEQDVEEEEQRRMAAANPVPKFLTDPDLSQEERLRRLRISAAFKGARNIKQYIITDPQGHTYVTDKGLNEFCRQYGLDSNNMSAVATGRRQHHRGWKAEHLPDHVQRDPEPEPPQQEGLELIPLTTTKSVLPSKVRRNRKRRMQRKLEIKTSTLSELEKERRRKIGERTRIRGKKYLFIDPEGREYILDSAIESVPDFCKKHKLMPSHMYSCANGTRPQHKGWKAQLIYQELPENNGQD